MRVTILNFYSFVNIDNFDVLFPKLMLIGKRKSIKGSILIAKEGFNGSIASEDEQSCYLLLNELVRLTGANEFEVKVNYSHTIPFRKLKIKLKNQIVNMGVKDIDVDACKGEYIDSNSWDEFIQQEEVVVIDTRNSYEVEEGSFRGAVNPETQFFRQFPEWAKNNQDLLKKKKIAMFCTGGIRCEKSTAYLKQLGYENVFHLKGGILQYLADKQNNNGMWEGNCFVFDDRHSVDDDLSPLKET